MSDLRIGSLCSGYGGLELGVQAVYGGTTAWVSDIDKGACKILAHRFPDVPNIGDMTTVDWAAVEPVDLICGGTPCQDLSHAGRRAGMTEGTRSNLWVAMREAIATIRPRFVVWENVGGAYSAAADSSVERDAGLLGDGPGRPSLRALGRVLGDLASLGYDASWHGIRAADVGAPHGRFRVFVLAQDAHGKRERNGTTSPVPQRWGGSSLRPDRSDSGARAGDVALLPTPAVNDMGEGKTVERWDEWTADMQAKHGNGNGYGKSLAIEAQRLPPTPRAEEREQHNSQDAGMALSAAAKLLPDTTHSEQRENPERWGDYAPAIARWEHVLGRPAPEPTMTSRKGNPQLAPAFVEWMMGLPAGWVTDVPDLTRNEALRALGNGVVPQQCAAALSEMAGWEAAA